MRGVTCITQSEVDSVLVFFPYLLPLLHVSGISESYTRLELIIYYIYQRVPNLIGGRFVDSQSSASVDVINPVSAENVHGFFSVFFLSFFLRIKLITDRMNIL